MKQKKEQSISNTKIAIVFFVFLAFILGISLIFKIIAVIGASQFDDSKRFTFTIANNKNIEIVSLSPDLKNITVFKLKDRIESADAGRLLKIPIDGFIKSDFLDLSQKINSLFTKVIFSYNRLRTNLTIIDLFKIAIFARSIPENSSEIKTVGDANGVELDKLVGHSVSDTFIEKDRQTIQIINATDIVGLGNRLARLVTNMGGNVIIVATSDSIKRKSTILYIDKKTYTVKRLQKVLGYEVAKVSGNAISDITITIGKDTVNSAPF